MSGPTPPTCKAGTWPAYNEALKRRGALTIHWPAGDRLQWPQGMGWFPRKVLAWRIPNIEPWSATGLRTMRPERQKSNFTPCASGSWAE